MHQCLLKKSAKWEHWTPPSYYRAMKKVCAVQSTSQRLLWRDVKRCSGCKNYVRAATLGSDCLQEPHFVHHFLLLAGSLADTPSRSRSVNFCKQGAPHFVRTCSHIFSKITRNHINNLQSVIKMSCSGIFCRHILLRAGRYFSRNNIPKSGPAFQRKIFWQPFSSSEMSSFSINDPVNLSESDIEKRLKEWEQKISIESLTSEDRIVHNRHLEAIKVSS